MAGNTAQVRIGSNALMLLGHPPVASFEEPGSGPQALSGLYEDSYISLLQSSRWRFATKKAQLARLTETPIDGYQYKYQLPADLVYLIRKDVSTDYEVYGTELHTNDNRVIIDYIYRVEEDNLPSYFIKAFEFFLAMQLAIPVTGNSTRASEYNAMYEQQMKRARHLDSTQRPGDTFIDSPYTEVRF